MRATAANLDAKVCWSCVSNGPQCPKADHRKMNKSSRIMALGLMVLPVLASVEVGGAQEVRRRPSLIVTHDELTQIASVAANSEFFAVGDNANNRVYLFDHRGHFLRAVGRPGQGPGEFQRVARVGLGPSLLVVYDDLGQRLTGFDPETGAVTWETRLAGLRSGQVGANGGPIRVLSDGTLWFGSAVHAPEPTRLRPFQEVVVQVTSEGEILRQLPLPTPPGIVHEFRTRSGGRSSIGSPYSPSSVWAPHPEGDGYVRAWGGRYEVIRHSGDGEVVDTLRRETEVVPPDAEARMYVTNLMHTAYEAFGAIERDVPDDFPNRSNFISKMWFGSSRELFIQRTTYRQEIIVDVITEGRYSCTLTLEAAPYRPVNLTASPLTFGSLILVPAGGYLGVPALLVYEHSGGPCHGEPGRGRE